MTHYGEIKMAMNLIGKVLSAKDIQKRKMVGSWLCTQVFWNI